MQFNCAVLALTAMASVAYADTTITVYACDSTRMPVATPTTAAGIPSSTGVVKVGTTSVVYASTGVSTSVTPTGSPITYATGAATVNGVSGSALGLLVAGGAALLF